MKKLFVPIFLFALLPVSTVLAQSPQNPPARPTNHHGAIRNGFLAASHLQYGCNRPSKGDRTGQARICSFGRKRGRMPQAPVENKKPASTR
ncbi:MAG: hypothetical protein U0176_10855 [Bacteroidia bacterium]